MFLQRLSILNYRNIVDCDLQFSPKINCFLGRNGMGKTNLLDAVYYLSFCKSHLNPIDSQIIMHNADFFMIQGQFLRNNTPEQVSCAVKRRSKKRFKRNQKEYERLSDHIGQFPVVLISPTDIDLVNEGSEARRRFMDIVISQFDKIYLQTLVRYNNALLNRNALLKNEDRIDFDMLEIYDEQLATEATYICKQREQFIHDFVPIFQQFYTDISGGNEQVGLTYSSHLQQGDLLALLADVRQRDIAVGYTTRGAHKDDLELTLGEHQMKRNGSQGQVKTYIAAMKLAQFMFLKQHCQVTPILLLDDIFDKLDAERVTNIIRIVSGTEFAQIFITDTNSEHLDEIIAKIDGESQLFLVENGKVSIK